MARRPLSLFIVGLRGGTSGGRGVPSNKQPEKTNFQSNPPGWRLCTRFRSSNFGMRNLLFVKIEQHFNLPEFR